MGSDFASSSISWKKSLCWGAGLQRADRVDFDPRVRLEFRGAQISSDGGLLVLVQLEKSGHFQTRPKATWGMSAYESQN